MQQTTPKNNFEKSEAKDFQNHRSKNRYQIRAFDKFGNEFQKTVSLFMSKTNLILSMGWPVEYPMLGKLGVVGFLPFQKDMCIDIMGRNHKGHPVFVSRGDLNRLFDQILRDMPYIHQMHQKKLGEGG